MNTKRLILLALIGVCMIPLNQAQAGGTKDGFYAGVAGVQSGLVVDSGSTTDKHDESSFSGGVYAGYKRKIYHGAFVAGETFYNHVAIDESYSNGDKIELDPQYGVKAHLGYEWGWGSLYGILGTTHFGYDLTQNDEKISESSMKALLGLGGSYQITPQWSTNLEFTTTGDKVDIGGDTDKSIGLVTARIGVSYHF